MTTRKVLLAEIDGRRARLAACEAGRGPRAVETHVCTSRAELGALLSDFAARTGARTPVGAAVAAAGPDSGAGVRLTGAGWSVDAAFVQHATSAVRVRVVNDFVARALAAPRLPAASLEVVAPGRAAPGEVLAVIGPGEGLGVAGLLPCPREEWRVLPGEGGHVALAAVDARQAQVLAILARRHGRVSAERVLSRAGVSALHAALLELKGATPPGDLAPEALIELAGSGDAPARETFSLFSAWIGAFASDVALTLGARGGVHLSGPLLLEMGALFDRALFLEAFRAKGRVADYVADIPVALVCDPDPALEGLAGLFTARDALAAEAETFLLDC